MTRNADRLGKPFTHGEYCYGQESVEHYTWRMMLARCGDTQHPKYKDYGGRGITVCDPWKAFENFLRDMGRRPDEKSSLGRIDNQGPYSPANCRWETAAEQSINKRSTARYEQEGVVRTLSEWAAILGISVQLAHWRMRVHGTFEKGRTWRKL